MLVSSSIIQYEIVDPEIVDIIKAINRLPQVSMTYYSCAGVGFGGYELYTNGKKKGHPNNDIPYIGLGYKADTDWTIIDEIFCSIGLTKLPSSVGFSTPKECKTCKQTEYTYEQRKDIIGCCFYFYKNYDPKKDKYQYYSKKQIKRMWNKLREKLDELDVL